MSRRMCRRLGVDVIRKTVLAAAVSLVPFAAASHEYGDMPLLGEPNNLELGPNDMNSLAFPGGMIPKQLHRNHHAKDRNHLTHGGLPQNWGDLGWRLEGELGIGSHTWFPGSHQVFSCTMRSNTTPRAGKFFSSLDPNCEGWAPIEFAYHIAFLSDTQLPGTAPLYRCYYQPNLDHFDTLSDTCEGVPGAVRELILGYIFI